MCYSGRCPYERVWTGECGKKPYEECPWEELDTDSDDDDKDDNAK